MFKQFSFLALGLGVCVLFAGCGQTATDDHSPEAQQQAPAEQRHDHSSEGPRGGHLIELGDCTYHAELLHDEATHTITVHLLDAAGKQDVAVDAPEIELQVFRDGEFIHCSLKPTSDAGPSSQFALVDETVCDLLSHADELNGRLSVTIDGQPLVGTVEHHDHDGHDHDGDHADHDHDDHDHGDHDHGDHAQ